MISRLYCVAYHEAGTDKLSPDYYCSSEEADEYAMVCRASGMTDVHVRQCDHQIQIEPIYYRLKRAIIPKRGLAIQQEQGKK